MASPRNFKNPDQRLKSHPHIYSLTMCTVSSQPPRVSRPEPGVKMEPAQLMVALNRAENVSTQSPVIFAVITDIFYRVYLCMNMVVK